MRILLPPFQRFQLEVHTVHRFASNRSTDDYLFMRVSHLDLEATNQCREQRPQLGSGKLLANATTRPMEEGQEREVALCTAIHRCASALLVDPAVGNKVLGIWAP